MLATPRQLQVLIVDDDDVDRERVRRCLMGSGLGAITHEAESGQEALAVLRSRDVDCVLLDNHLGDTTGALLLQQMRQLTSYAGPIIMVTGAGSEALVVEAMQEGASDYVPKLQLDAERLTRAIMRSLQLHETQEAERQHQRELARRLQEQAETLRQLDRTFQDILDQTANLIGYWDQRSCIRFGNQAHHDWLGIAPGRLAGMQVSAALGAPLHARHQPHIERALAGEPQQFEHEMPAMHGQPRRIVQVDYRPDCDEHGHVQGFYVTFTDLTQLVTARNQAQEVARIKSTFLANMSHEIRTPMNAIVGLSRLALEKSLPDEAREDIARVHDAAIALMGILDDILDHSKLEAGQMRIELLPVALDDVLRRTIDLFSDRLAQKCLYFHLEVAETVPARLRTDALRLTQVLNNLVGNAVKFTENGGITVRVTLRQAITPRVRFEVQDTGIGIEPARQSDLFTAFIQEDASITRRFGGSGLGLSICRSLVGMMDGEIGVRSTPGQGSVFWVEFPLHPLDEDKPSPPESPDEVGPLLWLDDEAAVPGLYLRSPALRAASWHAVASVDEAASVLSRTRATGRPIRNVVLNWHGPLPALSATLARLQAGTRRSGDTGPHLVLIVEGFERQQVLDQHGSAMAHVLARPAMPDVLMRALRTGSPRRQGEQAASGASSLRTRGQALQGKKALLVDDNPLNQMVAQAFLQQAGLDVTLADNGEQAVALADSHDFDVILMDMHMPVMDGLEATRRIRQTDKGRHTPIMAMTAAVLQSDREQCEAAGMVDMVPKPIIAEHLIDTLIKWLSH